MSKIQKKSVTLKDIALKAGISLATASRVISGRGYFSEESRKKVNKIVKDLGYKPHGLARSLKTKETDTIGLMITDIINPFYSYLADGVFSGAHRHGYHVIVCATNEDPEMEKEYIEVLLEKRAAGIIAVPTGHNTSYWEDAVNFGMEVVFVDREIKDIHNIDTILVDNVQGAYEAISYLISLGHTKIGLINGPLDITTAKGRLEGYCLAYNDAKINIKNQYIKNLTFIGESGQIATRELLQLKEPPTAIFAANNILGKGALKELQDNNIQVGKNFSLVIFDDVPWMSITNPSITAVSQPTHNLGFLALDRLYQRLKQKKEDIKIVPQKIILKPELIIRESCISLNDIAMINNNRTNFDSI